MKSLINNFVYYLSIILIIFIAILSIKYYKGETNRWKNNYLSEINNVKQYKDINNILVTEKRILNLTLSELKNSKDSSIRFLLKELDAEKVKYKKLVALGEINSNTSLDVNIPFVDSIIFLNFMDSDSVILDTIKIGFYEDKWVRLKTKKIKGEDSLKVEVESYHDYIVSVAWRKEGFFLFRWLKPKYYIVSVKDLNPYSKILGIKTIKIGKKR